MTAHPHPLQLPPDERILPRRLVLTKVFAICAIVGGILSIIGGFVDPHQFAYSWFFGFYYFFTIALGAFFWVTLHYACDSDWTVVVRRVWETMLALFPLLLLIAIPIFAAPNLREVLWRWMSPAHVHDHELALRAGYLNLPFFYIRVFAYFAYFIFMGRYYFRNSVLQDADGDPRRTRRMHDQSYFALVVFGTLQTFIGFDWLMGLFWRWYSSLFGVYNFAICAQASMAAGIVIVAMLRSGGHLRMLTHEHFYLMGKLLFGFTIFWAYIAFGQFLLIWYANIPEETIFYNDHNRGAWVYLSFAIIVGKFMFPTIYLLAQDNKKSLRALTRIAAWILLMHGLELYWFIMPYAHEKTVLPSWQDFVAWITIASILGFFYIRVAAKNSIFPTRDPRLVESLTVVN
jgi:hypothetical protein